DVVVGLAARGEGDAPVDDGEVGHQRGEAGAGVDRGRGCGGHASPREVVGPGPGRRVSTRLYNRATAGRSGAPGGAGAQSRSRRIAGRTMWGSGIIPGVTRCRNTQ